AIVAYPAASNLDEYKRAEQVADIVWARAPRELDGAALVVLPGSKEPVSDLAWLRSTGIDAAVIDRARACGPILVICGGLQLLGRELDGEPALGLLDIATRLGNDKLVRRRDARFEALAEPWACLS